MATYVNDLRLKEIGTGESSGTWGSETNTNLELIGEALGFGTEAITTNADTHTTTVADGSTDPGRAMYLKYTGTLDSACTITIAPNTMSRMHFIENGTSGSQNIIVSQGTGANVTIPAGDVKAVYLDGAGSGAAVTDAFASLNVVDLKVEDDLTVTDDATVGGTLGVTGVLTANAGVVVDNITIDGTEIDLSSGDLTLDVAGDIILDADGSTISMKDGGTNRITFNLDSTPDLVLAGGNASITASTSDADLSFIGNDGGSDVTALTLDMSENGHATFRAGATFNENSLDSDFRVESNGNANMLFVDAGNDVVTIGGSTFETADTFSVTEAGANSVNTRFVNTNADANGVKVILQKNSSSPADDDEIGEIAFLGQDDGGNANTYASIRVFASDVTNGTEDGAFTFSSLKAGSFTEHLRISSDGFLGIATTDPTAMLDVRGSVNSEHAVFTGGSNSGRGLSIQTAASGGQQDAGVVFDAQDTESGANPFIAFEAAGSEKMRILSDNSITMTANSVSPFILNIGGTASDAFRPVNMTVASTGARTQIAFNNPAGNIGSVSTSGTSTAFNTSSDYRLKENVVTDWDATTRLKQLKPSRFNFISDADTTLDGFLAHEVSSVVPEAITGAKDANETITNVVLDTNNNVIATNVEEDDWTAGKTGDNAIYPSNSTWRASHTRPIYQSIDQSKLVPLLVKTIQELEARITSLES